MTKWNQEIHNNVEPKIYEWEQGEGSMGKVIANKYEDMSSDHMVAMAAEGVRESSSLHICWSIGECHILWDTLLRKP